VQRIGPYQVLSELARGGMGVVYRAQGPDGREVALKLLRRAEDPRARRRFELEVRALAKLRHPHVVPILAAGDEGGSPWLALELVEGCSLEERLRHGPLPVAAAIRYAQHLAQALAYVHGCGVLHRDLKPANVLLRGDDALLTDFGLARDLEVSLSRITASGVFMGTPGYWAPEQARGDLQSLSPRTDLYGLGAVLYTCLTGRAPIEAQSLAGYLQTVEFERVRPPRELRPEVPEWLSALCMRCLAPDPARRPPDAEAVARALLLAQPLAPAPARRLHRWAAGLAAAAGLALGVALWARAGDGGARQQAERARALLLEGRAEAGLAASEAALELDPQQALAHTVRGAALGRLGHHEEALAALDRSLELAPGEPYAHTERGKRLTSLLRFEEALAAYERALALDPRYEPALSARCVPLIQLGRFPEALAAVDLALGLRPDSGFLHYRRGEVLARMGRPTEALPELTRALELDAGLEAEVGFVRAKIHMALGHHDDALRALDRVLELAPSAVVQVNRAVVLNSQVRHVEALEALDRAAELDPDAEQIQAERGYAYLGLKRIPQAIAAFDRALEQEPDGYVNQLRGLCHMRLGHLEPALRDFEAALRDDSLDPDVRSRVTRLRAQVQEQLAHQ